MNPQENVVPESHFDSLQVAPAPTSATQPMYWSVRREIWENQSIYMAPLYFAGVILLGFLVKIIHVPANTRVALAQNPTEYYVPIQLSFIFATVLILLTAFIVGMFYCLDALHGERRDRSVLFWKSLPVSDLTTVLSKASIPLLVLPVLIFAILLVTQLIILLVSTIALIVSGHGAAALWTQLPLFKMNLTLIYTLAAVALWHAPIYGWLLLVSSWARRTPLLWAVLPLLAISIFEKIAFHTGHFAYLVKYRLTGVMAQAFISQPNGRMPNDSLLLLDPGKFLSTPDLWIGLAVAVVFFAAAVRMRRYREPI